MSLAGELASVRLLFFKTLPNTILSWKEITKVPAIGLDEGFFNGRKCFFQVFLPSVQGGEPLKAQCLT